MQQAKGLLTETSQQSVNLFPNTFESNIYRYLYAAKQFSLRNVISKVNLGTLKVSKRVS